MESPQQLRTLRATRRTGTVNDTVAVAEHSSTSKGSFARRGAPNTNDAASIASLSSRVRSRSEIAEDDEIESSDVESEEDVMEDDSLNPDNKERYQIMASLLPDFTRATDELQHRLVNGDYNNKVFAAILKSKRLTFHALLENYQKPDKTSPFIDPLWVEDLNPESGTRTTGILLRANIVTALDRIQQIKDKTIENTLPILESLDTAFMHLFTLEESTRDHLNAALDLRTCYFVEHMAAQGSHPQMDQTITSVFGKTPESQDDAHLSTDGRFKSLIREFGAEIGDEEKYLVSNRIAELYELNRRNGEDNGLKKMRLEFPLGRTLDKLSQHLRHWYTNSKDAERNETSGLNGQNETGPDSFYDAEETISDSITESQPIMRPTEVEKRRVSLFRGEQSFRDLQTGSKRNSMAPPSNQQQHSKAPSPVPTDYSQDETRDLLLKDMIRSPSRVQKRKRITIEEEEEEEEEEDDDDDNADDDDDDDDDDDVFEDDTRQIPESRLAHIKARSAAQGAGRLRVPADLPSRSMPPPPRPTSSPPPSSTEPDYETIRLRKNENIARARARALNSAQHLSSSTQPRSSSGTITHTLAAPPKQRYVWSASDCNLLTKLVKEENAAWSLIEKDHNQKFEHPRNQQAYRDKARNMKVDFLIADAVLPPGFDLVTLGKKEVARLLSLGKNPYRRENERDGQKPLNTNI
ncbi:hypothetical protein NOR_04848 [Metarhizium rileyi]|uniref:Myb-like domain-containing protein n=1 Tax=Metarhizium rileyi (strain RCEF 4871) TaxID=1649241 RepID=A0A167DQG1_METRR|nr:hypothetical protein NOR_04848 [Metarhizium rileyi RCEF 4871]